MGGLVDGKVQAGERTYYTEGMHCAACEVVVEKKLLELEGIRAVEASTPGSRVLIEYEGKAPSAAELNKLFAGEGYRFSAVPPATPVVSGRTRLSNFSAIALTVIVALGLIILLQRAGLSNLVTVNSRSALPAFLLLGLVAGFSSCAALVGGIVLSMSKQWGELYSPDDPLKKRLEPHLLFNGGRLVSFAVFGAVLALIGGTLRLTPSISAVIVIAISLLMIVLALQMLGVRSLQRFQFTMPRSMTRFIADEKHFKSRYLPAAMGALTFFLPCGFAITAQSFALLSGRPLQGSLIMLFFALGTLPMLLVIGLTSVKFLEKPRMAANFLKVAGVIVLFFALFNINNQMVLLDAPNLGDLVRSPAVASNSPGGGPQLPPIVNGRQVVKMNASASGYSPSTLTVRAGVPVVWEITDTGTSGCTNAVIAPDLFSGQIALTPGTTASKEFTAPKAGQYRFSCWMGMVNGVIIAVEGTGKTPAGTSNTKKKPAPAAGGC
jgi:sulfite exporter TauE/SafE/copper chaperone CopZ/plastocyanin